MTEQGKREFLKLVVEKETTKCWSWSGDHDADGRPIFRGEKAYRVMYELRVGDVPVGFHVHHKCKNCACVNPRHLVALSPEDHRAVHATKNRAIQEQIYRGEWAKIQAAKVEAARLERERLERRRLEWERQLEEQRRERERLAEIERQRLAELAAENERRRQIRQEALRKKVRKFCLYVLPVIIYFLLFFWVIGYEGIHRLQPLRPPLTPNLTPPTPAPSYPTRAQTPMPTPVSTPTPTVTATPAPNYKNKKWPDGRILTHPEHFVNTGVVNVKPNDTLISRRKPGTQSTPVTEIPYNATDITAFDQDQVPNGDTWWCPVEWHGFCGYVSRYYLPTDH